ncbi:flavorubredoxin [Peptoniphilus olsenii]|uniref:Flavorubredoxin n=1 Tax=Peptoniphilus olsenii TaxID=411570 RepID=A0ABV2JCT6_9FIRM
MENLLSVPIKDDIYFIGTNDRQTPLFEGMWPLPNGVAYNSYLIKGDKNIIVDLVRVNTVSVYMNKIRELLDGEELDYIIINHMEPDHSSAIKAVLDIYPNVKIITNKKAVDMLNIYYEVTENIEVVKEGDTLELGNRKFTFYMTPMVHWPESMVTYEEATKTLFSQDIFGGFGTLDGAIFDDQIEFSKHYQEEITRYFINIVGKYSSQALKALQKLESLDIELICPVHGPVWRDNPQKVIDLYTSLAKQETVDGCVVIYGSMYGNTEQMAEAVAKGLAKGGIKDIKIRDITKTSNSYLLSDIWRYKGVILGSCSYDNNLFPPMDYLLSEISHQRMKNNYWGIFGSYSWSGGALKNLKKYMEDGKYDVLDTQLEIKGAATDEEIEALINFGKEMAAKILNK